MNQAVNRQRMLTAMTVLVKLGLEVRCIGIGCKFAKTKSVYDKALRYRTSDNSAILCEAKYVKPEFAPDSPELQAYVARYEAQ